MQPKCSVRSHTKPEVGRFKGVEETNAPEKQPELYLTDIPNRTQLDEGKSTRHAHLVHVLTRV